MCDDTRKRGCRRLWKRVRRDGLQLRGRTLRAHEGREDRLAGTGRSAHDGFRDLSRVRHQRRDEDDQQAVDVCVREHHARRPLVMVRRRRRQHVDRIPYARRRRQQGAQRLTSAGGQLRQLERVRFACVSRQNSWTTGIGQDCDSSSGGDRLMRQHCGNIEHFLERVGSNHAGLTKQRFDDRVAGRECARMRCRRARTSRRPARLDRHNRLAPANVARQFAELARVPEALQIQQDDVGIRIVGPELNEIVARHVGLVADRREGGETDVQARCVIEDRKAERAALRRQRDAAVRRIHRGERRIQPDRRIGVDDPHAVRPDQT